MSESLASGERRSLRPPPQTCGEGPWDGNSGHTHTFLISAACARWSPGPLAVVAFSCIAWYRSFVSMDGALLVSVADAPVLASGVATKLRNAAIANGDLVIPTSKGPLAGRQFRQLGQLAALTEVEAMALVGWIEEAYSEEAAQRFLEPLPHVCITAAMPSPAAPVSSAMAMGATSAVGGGLVPPSASAFASLLAGGSAPPATSTAAHVPLSTAAVAGPHLSLG